MGGHLAEVSASKVKVLFLAFILLCSKSVIGFGSELGTNPDFSTHFRLDTWAGSDFTRVSVAIPG